MFFLCFEMYVEHKRANLGTSDFRPVPVAVSCFACFYSLRTGCELKVSRFCADIKHWVKYWQIFYEDFHSLDAWKYFLFRMDKSWPKSYDLENSCWSCKTILRICQLDFANESNLRGWQFNSTSPIFFFWSKLSILVRRCISEKCLNWVRSPTGARVSFLASRELNFNCAHLYSFWQTLQVFF